MEQVRVPVAELSTVFERLLGGSAWAEVARDSPRVGADRP
jgi:hypothetical protein